VDMSKILKNKFFIATRGMFGENSVKYMNIELALTSVNYDDSGYGFDWGNKERGSKLLASAILSKISTPTIARIYADKYTDSVIQHFTQDNWSLEATEVAKWINTHTDYKIIIDDENTTILEENSKLQSEQEREEQAKEERRIQREKEFQQKIKEKLEERERKEEKRRREEKENTTNIQNDYKTRIEEYQKKIQKCCC